MNHPLVQHILSLGHLVVVLLISHLVAIFYQTDFQGIAVLAHITLILLNNGPKAHEKRRWQSVPKRSHKVLHLSEKAKLLSFIMKGRKKAYAEAAKIQRKTESPICEPVTKGKEIHASFAVTPQVVTPQIYSQSAW